MSTDKIELRVYLFYLFHKYGILSSSGLDIPATILKKDFDELLNVSYAYIWHLHIYGTQITLEIKTSP